MCLFLMLRTAGRGALDLFTPMAMTSMMHILFRWASAGFSTSLTKFGRLLLNGTRIWTRTSAPPPGVMLIESLRNGVPR